MGYKMSKELSVMIHDNLVDILANHELHINHVVNIALHKFFENTKQEIDNASNLINDFVELQRQQQLLEIDYSCLKQENKKLKMRIDDLAQLYPSAVTILGKKPESQKLRRKKWFFKR
jgi:hypothetical protein